MYEGGGRRLIDGCKGLRIDYNTGFCGNEVVGHVRESLIDCMHLRDAPRIKLR